MLKWSEISGILAAYPVKPVFVSTDLREAKSGKMRLSLAYRATKADLQAFLDGQKPTTVIIDFEEHTKADIKTLQEELDDLDLDEVEWDEDREDKPDYNSELDSPVAAEALPDIKKRIADQLKTLHTPAQFHEVLFICPDYELLLTCSSPDYDTVSAVMDFIDEPTPRNALRLFSDDLAELVSLIPDAKRAEQAEIFEAAAQALSTQPAFRGAITDDDRAGHALAFLNKRGGLHHFPGTAHDLAEGAFGILLAKARDLRDNDRLSLDAIAKRLGMKPEALTKHV